MVLVSNEVFQSIRINRLVCVRHRNDEYVRRHNEEYIEIYVHIVHAQTIGIFD